MLIGIDQNGRGKGDLLTGAKQPRFWPNEQQETCFSWNNQNADTGQVLGYGNNLVPTQHEGSDYVNLGAGLPANQIPAQVTAAYPASVNGGSAYDHEYPYPHQLVQAAQVPRPPRHPAQRPRLRRRRLLAQRQLRQRRQQQPLPLLPRLPLRPQQRRHRHRLQQKPQHQRLQILRRLLPQPLLQSRRLQQRHRARRQRQPLLRVVLPQ